MSSGKLIIRYLQSDAALRSGNTVTTTGTGGKYPPGLIVGYIEKIIPDPSGLSYSAVLRPAADLDDLTQVFIIVSNADKHKPEPAARRAYEPSKEWSFIDIGTKTKFYKCWLPSPRFYRAAAVRQPLSSVRCGTHAGSMHNNLRVDA